MKEGGERGGGYLGMVVCLAQEARVPPSQELAQLILLPDAQLEEEKRIDLTQLLLVLSRSG